MDFWVAQEQTAFIPQIRNKHVEEFQLIKGTI